MVPMAVTVLQSQLRTCEAVVSKNALSFLGGERERESGDESEWARGGEGGAVHHNPLFELGIFC